MLKRYYKKGVVEAGCDEAGRGCLAGPVFAAAVILPPTFKHKQLNDSKQLDEKTRYALRSVIEEEALAFAVASVDVDEMVPAATLVIFWLAALIPAVVTLGPPVMVKPLSSTLVLPTVKLPALVNAMLSLTLYL